MSGQTNETPALAFAFQARRTSTRKKASNNDRSPKQAKNTNTKDLSNAATSSSLVDRYNEAVMFSPLAGPTLNILNSTLTDPSLFIGNFDFDLNVNAGEHFDHFNVAPAIAGGLPSLNEPSEGISNESRNEEGEITHEHGLAMSELLSTPRAESLAEWSGQDAPGTAADTGNLSRYKDPMMEALDRLSELQTFIFKSFGSIPEGNLVSTFTSPDIGSCHSVGSASPASNLVGKVLLERIDDAWAAALKRESELNGGQHRDSVTATIDLLQSMLSHEGFGCEGECNPVGLASLILQVETVKRALRCHSAAQNR
ncbi:MAG: hypothetical protein Q9208_007860 [Pyrenodesmia sp. 3 TL-2023]